MAKILKSFRLKKRDIEYVDTLVSKGIFKTQTDAFSYFIEFYKMDKGLEVTLNSNINNWVYEVYTKLWPMAFGALFAFFFTRHTWFFVIPMLMALMPMIFKMELVEPDKIKVRV